VCGHSLPKTYIYNTMKRKNLTTGLIAILLLFSLFLLRNFEPIRMRKQDFGDIRLQKIEETTTETPYLIRFFDGETLVAMPLEEYVFCVVAAEMPASYESAALEAQAIAARTYTLYKSLHGGCKKYEGADICGVSGHCQAFADLERLTDRWGEDFPYYEKKIREAVEKTSGMVLCYENEPINALYHASSSGTTENVENVYSTALPYLVSVDTPEEAKSEVKITKTELMQLMQANYKGFTLGNMDEIAVLEHNSTGRVEKLRIGNVTMSGKTARKIFSLKSTDFEVKIENGILVFFAQGYGHGVGMSQKGANILAKDGFTAKEILLHYYSGVEINNIDQIKK